MVFLFRIDDMLYESTLQWMKSANKIDIFLQMAHASLDWLSPTRYLHRSLTNFEDCNRQRWCRVGCEPGRGLSYATVVLQM